RGRGRRAADPAGSRRGQAHRHGCSDHRGGPRVPRTRRRRRGGAGAVRIDVFTLFPSWFDWFRERRHVRNALDLGHELNTVDLRATTPLSAGQVDDTPYGGGAGMVVRV